MQQRYLVLETVYFVNKSILVTRSSAQLQQCRDVKFRVDVEDASRTCVHGASTLTEDRRTETSASKARCSLKDAGNVTEAKLTTSLLLLLNTRPRAPDLIRVDDVVRQTNERRESFTATSKHNAKVQAAAWLSRVAGGHVSSGWQPPPPPTRCRRGTCRLFQSALSVVFDVIITVDGGLGAPLL